MLVGRSNVGKSTLFFQITGKKVRTGKRPGILSVQGKGGRYLLCGYARIRLHAQGHKGGAGKDQGSTGCGVVFWHFFNGFVSIHVCHEGFSAFRCVQNVSRSPVQKEMIFWAVISGAVGLSLFQRGYEGYRCSDANSTAWADNLQFALIQTNTFRLFPAPAGFSA